MARGLRSSGLKRNKSKLRARVFGPVEVERLERLAKKQSDISLSEKLTGHDQTETEDKDGGTGVFSSFYRSYFGLQRIPAEQDAQTSNMNSITTATEGIHSPDIFHTPFADMNLTDQFFVPQKWMSMSQKYPRAPGCEPRRRRNCTKWRKRTSTGKLVI
jgi:hypothetical protein